MNQELAFESCVILDGYKTFSLWASASSLFESCVILDGYKTYGFNIIGGVLFESCVILDGYKTPVKSSLGACSLRVV